MGYQNWLADIVSDIFRGIKGFKVDLYPGWSARGSSHFDPEGVMNHHTGSNGSYDAILAFMAKYSSIAPLCNLATSPPISGVVRITVVSAGEANHSGLGYLPWTGRNNGNVKSLGIENHNNGSEGWPDQQHEGIIILTAGLLDHLGQPVDRAVDHKTYAPDRKWDRGKINVDQFRIEVKTVMDHGVQKEPPPPPYEPPPLDSLPTWQGKDDSMILVRIKDNPHHGDRAVYAVTGGALMRVVGKGTLAALLRDTKTAPMTIPRDHPYVVNLPVFNPGRQKWHDAAGPAANDPKPPSKKKGSKDKFSFQHSSLLKKGDDGAAVKEWQLALKAWDSKALPEFGADGDFGEESVKWTKKFQRAASIGVDGVVGPNTREAMVKELN